MQARTILGFTNLQRVEGKKGVTSFYNQEGGTREGRGRSEIMAEI